ncbi:hypothetical protein C8R44DRAFT_867155 [Mycena epipterygia]|nr:hypothetical protein C8R44DRAFT_867155 [Mycena epipterygia]
MATISKLAPSPSAATSLSQVWGSDGSMLPAAASVLDKKSVTAALTGPKTLVLEIEGRNVFILHGELMGLVMCLILDDSNNDESLLYTDHLNAVRLIDDSKTNPLKIIYTSGHSNEVSIPARMNFEADHYASSAQHHIHNVFSAPIPTFLMDDFTFHTLDDGWIESNIRNYVDKHLIVMTSD